MVNILPYLEADNNGQLYKRPQNSLNNPLVVAFNSLTGLEHLLLVLNYLSELKLGHQAIYIYAFGKQLQTGPSDIGLPDIEKHVCLKFG